MVSISFLLSFKQYEQSKPFQTPRSTATYRPADDSYTSLFITVPVCVVFLSLFGLLLARRFLL